MYYYHHAIGITTINITTTFFLHFLDRLFIPLYNLQIERVSKPSKSGGNSFSREDYKPFTNGKRDKSDMNCSNLSIGQFQNGFENVQTRLAQYFIYS